MKPLIGVVSRRILEEANPWYPVRQGVLEMYVSAIVTGGGVPIIVPLLNDPDDMREVYERLDGILLAGGGDVEPSFYGEQPVHALDRLDIHQDKMEIKLVKWAQEDHKPLLGICRGMQVINVALGGTLYQHLPAENKTSINHNISYESKQFDFIAHKILLSRDSMLAGLFKQHEITINSMHHQALKALAPSLKATGFAEDGVIEAVESVSDHYIVGIQGHPEWLMLSPQNPWRFLFEDFVEQCNQASLRPLRNLI